MEWWRSLFEREEQMDENPEEAVLLEERRPVNVCVQEWTGATWKITHVGPWNKSVRFAMNNREASREVREIQYGREGGILSGELIYKNY